mgnify:CR=1 FL=1|jgi:hypothetical protein|tara:strand:- start:569 stop:781 length:213 start_codon:yes stop_codon:yes gene_type:complete
MGFGGWYIAGKIVDLDKDAKKKTKKKTKKMLWFVIVLLVLALIVPFAIGQWIDGETILDLHLKPFGRYSL